MPFHFSEKNVIRGAISSFLIVQVHGVGGRRLLPFLYRHLRKFKLITLHFFHVHRDAFSERIFAAILTFNASCQS